MASPTQPTEPFSESFSLPATEIMTLWQADNRPLYSSMAVTRRNGKMVNRSRFYRALESVSIASALSTALTIYPCQIRVHQTPTVLNSNFLQLGRSGGRPQRTVYPWRLPVNWQQTTISKQEKLQHNRWIVADPEICRMESGDGIPQWGPVTEPRWGSEAMPQKLTRIHKLNCIKIGKF